MDDSFKIIFLDINNIIPEENVELKDGDDLKPEIKEKCKVINSILDNFIENNILVDVEKEEKYSFQITSFIYRLDKTTIKTYKFYLFRQINEHINIDLSAFCILFNLEKECSKELVETLIGFIEKIDNIKICIFGYYKSKNNIVTTKENIEELFTDENDAPIDHKYLEIDLNKDSQNQVNKYIGELMQEIYNEGGKKINDRGDRNAQSGCILI